MTTSHSHGEGQHSPTKQRCLVCHRFHPHGEIIPLGMVQHAVAEHILQEHPEAGPVAGICRTDLQRYRTRYIEGILEADRGELTALEREVLSSLERHETLARNVESQFDTHRTFGDRLADRVASLGGSWTFIGIFFGLLVLWIGGNSLIVLWRPFDPYPYIFLNLMLSCLAAVQAPVIMMSQNRQEAKDRLRSEQDFRINLKAELEIRHLHSKLDQLLSHQWQRLLEIQQMQTDMLAEIAQSRQ